MKTYKEFLLEDYWNDNDLDFNNMLNLKQFKIEKENEKSKASAMQQYSF